MGKRPVQHDGGLGTFSHSGLGRHQMLNVITNLFIKHSRANAHHFYQVWMKLKLADRNDPFLSPDFTYTVSISLKHIIK